MCSPEELYCVEQINIPITFPEILKVYAKAAIRTQPYDLLKWSSAYFRALANGEQPPVKERFDHPPFTHPTGLTPSYLRILFNQFGQPSYGSCVALKTLFRRWQGIALSDLLLYRILMIGHILKDEIDLYQFLAISCGLMGNNLLDTMILICEVLTEEPSGGSAMIPVKIMANLYGYLGSLDCTGKAPSENHEIASNAVETYSPTCSVKDALLPETISRESESICTYEVSEKKTHYSSNESFEASEQKITRNSVDVKTLDDDKSQDDSAHWDEETDKTSTEVLENDGSTRSILDEAVKVQEETHLPSHDDNEPLLHTVHENSEGSEGNANGELMNTEENVFTKTSAGEINEVEDGSEWVEHVRKQRDDNVEHPGLGNIREESCKCLVGEMRNVVDDGKKMKEERSKSPEVSDDEENDFAKVFVKRIEKNHSPLHVDYNVPGIGGTVSMERVNAVLVWLMDCSRRQEGMVGPRNLRHFMCPRLFDECNDDGDCNNCEYDC